jgi:squalene cyclase
LGFLRERQGVDGLWRDFRTLAGEGVDWPTGFIGSMLAVAGVGRGLLEPTADALATRQHEDGGWGYHADVPTDADSTACVTLFLAALGRRDATVRRAAACLERHQDPASGGVPTFLEPGPIRRYMRLDRHLSLAGWCGAHLEVTAMTGRALAQTGVAIRRVTATWCYVKPRQHADGCWHSYWWTTPHYATLQAVELARAVGDPHTLRRAAAWARREQRPGGGWCEPTSAFATALSLSLLLAAGARGRAVARARDRLVALQEADGGWPGDAEMRIPPPHVDEPDEVGSWRYGGTGTRVVTHDHNRLLTTATCVSALARCERSGRGA